MSSPSGGYTVGPKPLIDLLRQRSRPYLFSNALPPPVVGCATRAVELLLASNEIAQSMTAKTMRWVLPCRRYANSSSIFSCVSIANVRKLCQNSANVEKSLMIPFNKKIFFLFEFSINIIATSFLFYFDFIVMLNVQNNLKFIDL